MVSKCSHLSEMEMAVRVIDLLMSHWRMLLNALVFLLRNILSFVFLFLRKQKKNLRQKEKMSHLEENLQELHAEAQSLLQALERQIQV